MSSSSSSGAGKVRRKEDPTSFAASNSRNDSRKIASSSLVMNNSGPNDPKFVFSCRSCRNIIGDSLSLICTYEEMRTITVSGTTNKIAPEHTLRTSVERFDEGSTFYKLLCTECVQPIGKYYVSTPRTLDPLRDKYTLFVDSLESYQLGKVDLGNAPSAEDLSLPQAANNQVADDIGKIQHVLVDLVLRLAEVERLLGVNSGITTHTVPTVDEAAMTNSTIPSSPFVQSADTNGKLPPNSGIKRSAKQASTFLLGSNQQSTAEVSKKQRI